MGMVVQHNMTAANANRNLGVTCGNLAKSTEKLSSGYKINRAGDNAAGLAISEKMRGQIRGLDKASANAEDGISMIQTAEGALTETHSILQRMRELAVQSSSDTNTDDDRTQIQNEIDQLTQEVDRIATTTEFNTKKLLDGSRKGSVSEKDGTAKVDSTFANSTVSAAITTDNTGKTAYTDAIRVEFTADFTEGQSTKSTAKYTDGELQTAYGSISTKMGAIKNYAQGRADAITTAESTLSTAKDNLYKNQKAEETNGTLIDKAVKDIAEYTDATLLASGMTKDDLKSAMTALVDAYVAAGQTTTGTTATQAAEDALGAVLSGETTTITSTSSKDVLGTTISTVKEDNTTDAVTAGITAKTTVADLTGELKADLIKVAKKQAAVITHLSVTEKDEDDAQRALDILSNDDLCKAAYDLGKGNADLTGAGADVGKKEAAQTIIDDATNRLKELNKDKAVLSVSDLFGSSEDEKKFEISSAVDKDNNLTINLKNKSGDDTVITIANADKIKAGDVVTITAKEMVETEQAATGKEAFRLQVGANAGQEVALGINSMKAKDLNIVQTKEGVEGKALDVTTQAGASLAIQAYDMAIQSVSTERAKMGVDRLQ